MINACLQFEVIVTNAVCVDSCFSLYGYSSCSSLLMSFCSFQDCQMVRVQYVWFLIFINKHLGGPIVGHDDHAVDDL